MLRLLLMAAVVGMVIDVTPASALDCVQWCRTNKCNGGMTAGAAPQCMNQCVAVCQQKSKGK